MTTPAELAGLIARHAPGDGTFPCAIPGVQLIRASAPTMPMPVIYEPTVCFIAQGGKRAMLGTTAFDYAAGNHLVASVGLPVMGAVVEASEAAPYLSLQLDLDAAELSELAIRYPRPPEERSMRIAGLMLFESDAGLLDAAARLVRLLDTPNDIDMLAPNTIREILYRLITAPGGSAVRDMAQGESRLSHIAQAIVWIRAHFREACRIETAAEVAGMSRSTFHHHFKAITAMSPIEFRTQLRLQEARRLMLSNGIDAASAGFSVGYDSPSHFSRDYSRIFGLPPGKDIHRLRATTFRSPAAASRRGGGDA